MLRLILFFFLTLASVHTKAQINKCQFNASPSLKVNDDFRIDLRESKIMVPMVFHVVYSSEEENIPKQKILEQIEIINKDFNAQNIELVQKEGTYKSILGNARIEFYLATTDPVGNSSEGIIRSQTNIGNIGDKTSVDGRPLVKYSELGGQKAWPTQHYLNIWVCSRQQSLAYTADIENLPSQEDGIVIDYNYVGTNSTMDYNLGRTLTHELGHYFGLLHPWGLNTGCDEEYDGVEDTEDQANPNFSCMENYFECSGRIIHGNFMDFASDECLFFFTRGQVFAMHNFIFNNRKEFLPNDIQEPKPIFEGEMPYKIILNSFVINIYFQTDFEWSRAHLYSINGTAMASYEKNSEYFLNIDKKGIPTGIYLLVFETPKGPITEKIYLYE